MQLPQFPYLQLTYCQNIHPGETWEEHLAALQSKATAVKAFLEISSPFGLGLRLSATAAAQLQEPGAQKQGSAFFEAEGLYPFSINGFPYGRFHRGPVKEKVYAPDWRTPERLEYTIQLARALAGWLPENQEGSISTVPGSFAPWITTRADELQIARQLGAAAAALSSIESQSGRLIHLGLEPEPDCFLETTQQTLDFFATTLPEGALPEIRSRLGISENRAHELLLRHVGVCFDTCHAALQYEDLASSLRAYRTAGVRISKVQLSAALKAPATLDAIRALAAFKEPTYLHQVKARTNRKTVKSWSDLPEALAHLPLEKDLEELRVHFHVPLYVAPESPLCSTADALDDSFWNEIRSGISPHLEIETYTFDVLPPEVHPGDIIQSIANEYRWVLKHLEKNSP